MIRKLLCWLGWHRPYVDWGENGTPVISTFTNMEEDGSYVTYRTVFKECLHCRKKKGFILSRVTSEDVKNLKEAREFLDKFYQG